MVDTDVEKLLTWWYNKPDNWAGTYKEDDDGDIHFSEKSTLWSVWGLEGSKIQKCDFFKGSKSGFMYVEGF